MMWLPAVIALGTIVCVAIAAIKTSSIGMSWLTLVGCVNFTLAMTDGFAVTFFATPGPDDWWQAPLVRVVWQIGSSFVLALAAGLEARGAGRLGLRSVWALIVGLLVLGPLASLHPLRDLLSGPIPLRVVDFEVVKTPGGARGGSRIFGTLRVRAPEGAEQTLDLVGWGANDAEDRLRTCDDVKGSTVVVLAQLERVIDVRCR